MVKVTPTSVLRNVKKPRGGRLKNTELRSREYLTPAEVERLASAAKRRGRYGSRDALMIRFCARHGLRVSELVDLRWDQLDLDMGEVHIRRSKRGNPSIHPLLGEEIRALRRHRREWPESRFVFTTERKAPMTRSGFLKMLDAVGTAAKFELKVHPHMLRHACGYRLANEDKPTRGIQRWMGHRNINTTVMYTELAPDYFKDW